MQSTVLFYYNILEDCIERCSEMNVYVRIKSIGKNKATELRPYELPEGIGSVRELIKAFVHAEVERFNDMDTELPLLTLMSAEDIEREAKTGRVAFGRLWPDKKADEAKAVDTALAAFGDGLFRVLMDEEELTDIDTEIEIKEGAVFTFIRLTFLSGRMW